jgi:Uma2 family endonuclease
MATGTLVSVEEYLNTSYESDCDYVDGQILERNVGEWDHSRLQGAFIAYFRNKEKQTGLLVAPELRVQVTPTRFRVPDVCLVIIPWPGEQILRTPPFLCIEILSKDDRYSATQDKIDDYLKFGVNYVWVVEPQTLRAHIYSSSGVLGAKDGILTTGDPDISLSLSEL